MSDQPSTLMPWRAANGQRVTPLGEARATAGFHHLPDLLKACHSYAGRNRTALAGALAAAVAQGHAPSELQLEMEARSPRVVALPRDPALAHRQGDDGSHPSPMRVPVLVLPYFGGFWLSHAFTPEASS